MVNRKAYLIAVRRGMFFEIKYSPAIADSNNRKDMIKVAQNYCTKGKSRNIIFSSGAANEFQLRGPYDVANLWVIFDSDLKRTWDIDCWKGDYSYLSS